MRLALVAVVVVAAAARPSEACSFATTFTPTSCELVATTTRIVLAKAIRATVPADREDELDHWIHFQIVRALKGPGAPGERVALRGTITRDRGASSPHDFSRAREGFPGNCVATDFALGRHYLLFLQRHAGPWEVRGIPFARVTEEVATPDDPWTIAVATYARIAALPRPDDRRRALESLVQKTSTPADKAIAEDAARHLATPTPYKSFAELDAMYRSASDDARDRIALAIGKSGDRAARAFMKDLVATTRAGAPPIDRATALEAIAAYYERVSDPAMLAPIAELYVALGKAAKHERRSLVWLLIRQADASHQNVMERALAGADDDEAGRLVQYFMKVHSENARAEIARRVGSAYEAWPDMTIGLAALRDPGALAWARQKIAASPEDDNGRRWAAIYAIAVSPLADADAGKIIAAGGRDRVTLIHGYTEAHHPKAVARLAQLARMKLDAEAARWLRTTLKNRTAR